MPRSCGTCRDRRISCDRATPTCAQCARSNRACKGYGIRLSWPKASDARRAVVGIPSHARRAHRQRLSSGLVTVSDFDIKMHYYLSSAFPSDLHSLSITVPIPFTPIDLTALVESTASKSLALLGHNPIELGRVLIRMALANSSPSSTAVRHALLGLSSLHRYELTPQCFELKISAIKALNEATHTDIGPAEALQHVAAGMLLCSFEIHKASCTSSQWRWFVTGVKQVLNASTLLPFRQDSTFTALMDWVFYHETLGRFSLLHWRPATQLEEHPLSAVCSGADHLLPTPTNTLLRLFKEACYLLATDRDTSPTLEILQAVAQRIQALPLPDTTPETPDPDPTFELFHLAILIYLNRMTNSTLEPQSTTQFRIERAFTILHTLKVCPRQFPLFIIGAEAATDEQRCTVLALMERTEKSPASRSLFIVRALTKALWVQDDLAAGERGTVAYREKMDAIVSVCSLLPTFV
ncbi:fungal-specific transcription factor domain-containing protein [Aspergillus pseudoustus]|uniref:Fungal-specific transcription factor domain-containing protein n=1 Tax=Aspergillus pseudoustus TaxID=1810923 RepID=A0ABR4IBK1_9EURO